MLESISQLKRLMATHGAVRLYAKKLSPNDNSKNQVYLGGDFSSLNVIPNKGVYTDSNKEGSKRDRFKADITFFWVDEDGKHEAPKAQLILYPKYPEVRMSGFLAGCKNSPSELMRVRDEGRLLFFGITRSGDVLGYVVGNDSNLRKELDSMQDLHLSGVFIEVPFESGVEKDSKIILLDSLRSIHEKHWINSCKLCKDGSRGPCNSSNCGGYTLEAELGVMPNGFSEPDYHGWEIKQHGVKNLAKPLSGGPTTLMTPEPTAGHYKEHGVESFIRKFGYADKRGREDRLNFGGIYKCGRRVESTGLTLLVDGYNDKTTKIENPEGGITLFADDGEPAAIWKFADIMTHWNRKHAKAAYIPSMCRTDPERQYCYGQTVRLGEGTDFYRLLKAVAEGKVYYDPGIKLENASGPKPKSKRRSQFRMKQADLGTLYHSMESVDLLGN